MEKRYFTIPRLAARLGVTPPSVRLWIARGYIDPPPELPVTGERAYPSDVAERIEGWFLERAAKGKTRGPGARQRRETAKARLSHRADLTPNPEQGVIE